MARIDSGVFRQGEKHIFDGAQQGGLVAAEVRAAMEPVKRASPVKTSFSAGKYRECPARLAGI